MTLSHEMGSMPLPQPHTRLPAMSRSPSPNPNHFLDTMKDLVPAPLRRSRSPNPRSRSSEEWKISRPYPVEEGRSSWEPYRPSRPDLAHQARSLSPPRAPRLALSNNSRSRSPPPARPRSPPPQYHRVRRDFLTVEQVENLPVIRNNQRPAPYPSPPSSHSSPSSSSNYSSPRSQSPSPPSSRSLPLINSVHLTILADRGTDVQSPDGLGLRPAPLQPRKNVASMVEYLSLEQLEHLWQAQDQCRLAVDLPHHPTSPMFRIESEDPRSPIHPAFRHRPELRPHQNSFAHDRRQLVVSTIMEE